MIALIDYGIGNLRSVEKALRAVGAQVHLTSDPQTILNADKVILPGVGAFGDGMDGLRVRKLVEPLRTIVGRGTPLLGICVGMQVLFDESEEHGRHEGLGLLPGRVRRFPDTSLKVPQTGWNQLHPHRLNMLLEGLPKGAYAYFNHSYYCDPARETDVVASTEYGRQFASIVGRDRLYGVQFHPEKSQQVGLHILRNFIRNG